MSSISLPWQLRAPKHLILDKLRETLEEIKTREPDAADKYRARVVFVGSGGG